MKNIRKKLSSIKNIILERNHDKIPPLEDQFRNQSFSQEGEDMILSRFFEGKEYGTFVDVGAHHPFRFSNTYLFYKKGWRGINIDPLPTSKELFDKYRPEDNNLCIGISNSEENLKYYMFNEPALNTFSEKEAEEKNGIHNGRYYIEETINVPTKKLSTILNENSSFFNGNIDFLSIDVEGFDMEVLLSNDWTMFRPQVVLVEELRTNIPNIIKSSEVYDFLVKNKYNLFFRSANTSFYVRID